MASLIETRRRILSAQPHIETISGDIATFKTDMAIPLKSLVVDIPVTQSGTGDPSPDNVRPFIGRTALMVYNEPHNSIFPGLIHWNQMVKNGDFANGTTGWTGSTYTNLSVSDGTLTVSTTATSNRSYNVAQSLNTIEGHIYYATAKIRRELDTVANGSARTGYALRVGGLIVKSYTLEHVGDEVDVSEVFTADTRTSINVIKDGCKPAAGSALFSIRNVMLIDLTEAFGAGNEPTAEEFRGLFPAVYYEDNTGQEMTISEVNNESYNTLNISFPTEAGTVYGGYVDLVNGELVAEKVKHVITPDGFHVMSRAASTGGVYFYKDITLNTSTTPGQYSANNSNELYSHGSASNPYTDKSKNCGWIYKSSATRSTIRLGFTDEMNITTVEELYNWINNNDEISIVYPLESPIHYSLTPSQLTTFLNYNNIWSDAGTTTVKYWTH